MLRIGNPDCKANGVIKNLNIEGIEFSNAKVVERMDSYGPVLVNMLTGSNLAFERVAFNQNQREVYNIGTGTPDSTAALLVRSGDVTVTDCQFLKNNNEGSAGAGAVWIGSAATVAFETTTFTQNSAREGKGGGAVLVEGSASFAKCSFANNSVEGDSGFGKGGAVHIVGDGENVVTFEETVFAGNAGLEGSIEELTSADVWIQNTPKSVTFDGGTLCPACSGNTEAGKAFCTCEGEGEGEHEGEGGEHEGGEAGESKTSTAKIVVPIIVIVVVTGGVLLYTTMFARDKAAATVYNPEFENPVAAPAPAYEESAAPGASQA